MSASLSAKHIKAVSQTIRDRFDRPGFEPFGYPFMPIVKFIPPGVPYEHPIRELYDGRGYAEEAPNGYWDVEIWHLVEDHVPVAMAAFVLLGDGKTVAERLSVDADYRGLGLGRRLIDLGQRLWGGPVVRAEEFTDDQESFWCS